MTADRELGTDEVARQVRMLISVGRFEQAASLVTTALAREPQSPELLYLRAFVDYRLGHKDDAEATARSALRVAPEHFGARHLLSVLAEARDDLPEAERLLIGLLKENPADADLYAQYAMLMFQATHIDKGRALAREAIAQDPENENALIALHLGELIDGRSEQAEANLARLVARHPDSALTMVTLVKHLMARARYRPALRVAVELLRSSPRSAAYVKLVKELRMLSNWTMAPLWPIYRWGTWLWYLVAIALVAMGRALEHVGGPLAWLPVAFALTYVAYSWIWPRLLRRILR